MQYISGLYALNLPCNLNTTGDWHPSSLKWDKITLLDSTKSIFKDYGIEQNRSIPEHSEQYNVANHIRAILDLLNQKQFSLISNFNKDFICNDNYTSEIFHQVKLLLPDNEINNFMHKTYGREWRIWIGEQNMEKY